MITSLRLVNFKNFADETLRLGPFTVIIGANASGKSNIRDAFRFLHGIGRGYTLAEILGGKYGPGGYREWEGIRGAPNEVARMGHQAFSVEVKATPWETGLGYVIEVDYDFFNDGRFRVKCEEFSREDSPIFDCYRDGQGLVLDVGDVEGRVYPMKSSDPFLSDATPTYWPPGETSPIEDPTVDMKDALANLHFLEPVPDRMREPAFPGATILGDRGENLPSVLEAICTDSGRGRTLMSWLQELTPMDVKDFDFPRDPSGRVHLQIVERNGRKVSAYSASDGTLRFLAILAALLSPDRGGIYFFEEIDTSIHPARLWLLLDFIEKQTAKGDVQVVTTTHSPALLDWINDKTFEHTSLVYRDDYWADSVIRPIAQLPSLEELRKSQGLGRLFTSSWMENTMAFTEGEPDTDYLDDDDAEEDV